MLTPKMNLARLQDYKDYKVFFLTNNPTTLKKQKRNRKNKSKHNQHTTITMKIKITPNTLDYSSDRTNQITARLITRWGPGKKDHSQSDHFGDTKCQNATI